MEESFSVLLRSPKNPISLPLPVGGRLQTFLMQWENITKPYILNFVIQGYKIEFTEAPLQDIFLEVLSP